MTLNLGWFTTARGAGSRSMFEAVTGAIDTGVLDARITVVFCNREPGEDPVTDQFFALVRERGIPLVTCSSVRFRLAHGGVRSRSGEPLPEWRTAYDRAVAEGLRDYPFDLGVLAGYMLIFGAEFVSSRVLLNLHPALPGGPTGTWREVIRMLIRTRAAESGVMLHLAIAEVDAGPVVAYCRYSLRGPALDPLWAQLEPRLDGLSDAALDESALFAAIRAEGMQRESPLLIATLAAFAGGRRHAEHGRVIDASGQPATEADLTAEVATLLGSH